MLAGQPVIFFNHFYPDVDGRLFIIPLLHRKINESKTGLQILAYSLLLSLVNTGLFFGGLFVLIISYEFLMDDNNHLLLFLPTDKLF